MVAEAMNNYILFDHVLKCSVVAQDNVHPLMFEGSDKKFRVFPSRVVGRFRHNREKSPEKMKKVENRLLAKEKAKRQELKELGIDYDFPGYVRYAYVCA